MRSPFVKKTERTGKKANFPRFLTLDKLFVLTITKLSWYRKNIKESPKLRIERRRKNVAKIVLNNEFL